MEQVGLWGTMALNQFTSTVSWQCTRLGGEAVWHSGILPPRVFSVDFSPLSQEDAETLWRGRGQAGAGVDPLWITSGERCDRAPIFAGWGKQWMRPGLSGQERAKRWALQSLHSTLVTVVLPHHTLWHCFSSGLWCNLMFRIAGLPDRVALSVFAVPLPPTFLSVGIPEGRGTAGSISSLSTRVATATTPACHPSQVCSETNSNPSSQGTGDLYPRDSERPLAFGLYRSLLLDFKEH